MDTQTDTRTHIVHYHCIAQ